MTSKNLSFSLIDSNIETKNKTDVTYDSLVSLVNEQSKHMETDWNNEGGLSLDDYVASEIDYNENYTKKQLDLIADYYEISKSINSELSSVSSIRQNSW